jgi:carboxyl-terminal processing protease
LKLKSRKLLPLIFLPVAAIAFGGGFWLKHNAVSYGTRTVAVEEDTMGRQYASLKPERSPLDTFFTVFAHLRRYYVDEKDITDQTKLSYGALRGAALYFNDPDTRFMEPKEFAKYRAEIDGTFQGIGATVAVQRVVDPVTSDAMRHELEKLLDRMHQQGEDDADVGITANSITKSYLAVLAPVPGGPADKAGLLPGDRIEYINGKWVLSYNPNLDFLEVVTAWRNKKITRQEYDAAFNKLESRVNESITPGEALELLTSSEKPIKVKVRRNAGNQLVEATIAPGKSELEAATWSDLGGTGYIRIATFSDHTTGLVRSAINTLQSKGVHDFVLDLRSNSRGTRQTMLETLGLFLPKGSVAQVKARQNVDTKSPLTIDGEPVAKGKFVVLVNRGTANLAEVFASALKERAGAKLVGDPTAGDPMAVDSYELPDHSALIYTSGKYFTSNGTDFGGAGLKPDVSVAAGKVADPASDPAVAEAKKVVRAEVTG